MECERRKPPALSPPAAAMSLVLGDDDLLGEILLCLAFPTSLVRAALACKCWLRVASDHAFLRRFRARHPPRLLGFYALGGFTKDPEFRPVRHPPELASAARRAASALGVFLGRHASIVDSRDGRLLISFVGGGSFRYAVLSPLLCPEREGATLPLPERVAKLEHCTYYSSMSMKHLPEHGGDGLQCFELVIYKGEQRQATVQVYVLNDGVWTLHASVKTEFVEKMVIAAELAGNNFYMTTFVNTLVLDLVSSRFFVIDYPEKFHGGQLSKANGSGVYLINLVGNGKLNVWLHRTDSGSVGNWLLVDTICLKTIFADLGMPVGIFTLRCVGDNAEHVLLEMGDSFFHFNIRSRATEKLFEVEPGEDSSRCFLPFTMIWPPKFPTMKKGHDLEE